MRKSRAMVQGQFQEPSRGVHLGPRHSLRGQGLRLPPGMTGVLPPSRLERQECAGSAFSRARAAFSGELPGQALLQRPNQLVLSVRLGEQLPLKIAPCSGRPAPARACTTALGVRTRTVREAPAPQGPTPTRAPGRVRSAGATGAAEGGRSDAGRDGRRALGLPSAGLGLAAAAGAPRGRALRGHALQPR